jgi:hypothetical protein
MPHLRTDAGVDLELERDDDGTVRIAIANLKSAAALAGHDPTADYGLKLTPAEARMIGDFLAPPPPPVVDGAELRARATAQPRAKVYDPTVGIPTNWPELATYARHLAGKGLEVAIVTAGPVPELEDLNGIIGITYRVDETIPPPGRYDVGRNGQRIASYHLGGVTPPR